eukprot:5735420-Pyramimonas_sp.AAC.1
MSPRRPQDTRCLLEAPRRPQDGLQEIRRYSERHRNQDASGSPVRPCPSPHPSSPSPPSPPHPHPHRVHHPSSHLPHLLFIRPSP